MKVFPLLAAVSFLSFPAASHASNYTIVVGQGAAERCFRMALALNHSQNALDECNAALDHSMSFDDQVGTYVNRGIVYMLSNESDAAMTDFDRALLLNPQQPEAWLNKGINQFRVGDNTSAVEFTDRALTLNTVRPEIAYYIRGLANERLGNVRAAYNDLRQAQTLAPTWQAPSSQLRRYRVTR